MPPLLRCGTLVALVKVLLSGVRTAYERLQEYREAVAERLDTTANVASMERALNGAFHLKEGQIYIESGEDEGEDCWHFEDEGQAGKAMFPAGGHGLVMKKEGESSYGTSFTVWVPSFLCTDTNPEADKYGGLHLGRIKTIVEYYKPAGRTYRIAIYDYD